MAAQCQQWANRVAGVLGGLILLGLLSVWADAQYVALGMGTALAAQVQYWFTGRTAAWYTLLMRGSI